MLRTPRLRRWPRRLGASALAFTLLTSVATAADISLRPPAGQGVVIQNNAGTQEHLRVQDNGTVSVPQLGAAVPQSAGVCHNPATGVLGPCSIGSSPGVLSKTVTLTDADFPPTGMSTFWYATSSFSSTGHPSRYHDIVLNDITQDVLDTGSVQVFMTPAFGSSPNSWVPMPFSWPQWSEIRSYGLTYMPVTELGKVRVHVFTHAFDMPSTPLPDISTRTLPTAKFKVVITPATGQAN